MALHPKRLGEAPHWQPTRGASEERHASRIGSAAGRNAYNAAPDRGLPPALALDLQAGHATAFPTYEVFHNVGIERGRFTESALRCEGADPTAVEPPMGSPRAVLILTTGRCPDR